MKLITEVVDRDIEYIVEGVGDNRRHAIEGVFMQAEKKNKNGRVYPRDVLESTVEKYIKEQVSQGRAVGELDHPDGPAINLDKVSHRIVELNWSGNNVVGKAVVLDTPNGNIVKGLMGGGVRLGVSSRGMGSLEERGGVSTVKNDFVLSAVDVVADPSAPEAFVNGIMEGVEYFWENGLLRAQKIEEQKVVKDFTSRKSRNQRKELVENQLRQFVNLLKG